MNLLTVCLSELIIISFAGFEYIIKKGEIVKSHCVKLILMSIQSTRILLDPLYRRVALMI